MPDLDFEIGSALKFLLLLVLTVLVFKYASEGAKHKLNIPEDSAGQVIVKIKDSELEDAVNDFFKIPLRFFPREICLKNNNHVYSDNVEVQKSEVYPDVGSMKLFIEKDGGQLIDPIPVLVGETACKPISVTALEGATTTANYVEVGSIEFHTNPDGSINIIGGHQTSNGFEINVRTDVSKTQLWIGLSMVGRHLLFLFSFLGVSTLTLTILEILKRILRFIKEDQF
jgi:hypothetical protein